MGGVAPGSPVSAANTNSAFLEKNADDATVGKVGLNNTDPLVSGPFINNIQAEFNGIGTFIGRAINGAYNTLPPWTSNDVGISTDPLFARADKTSAKFNQATGHTHTGTPQDAPQLNYLTSLTGTQLKGYALQEPTLTGVTGLFTDVSTPLAAETPSTGQTVEGIVSNAPVNIVQLFDTSGNAIETGGGDKIYGRITNTGGLGGTWTLTYYYLSSGVETAWNFTTPTDIVWWPQKLYNESNRPVYSDQFVFSTDLLAGEIPDATTATKGKVLLATAAPQPVGLTPSTGVGPRVAVEDHVHQGVHNINDGTNVAYGDVEITGAGGTTTALVAQIMTITSPALTSSAPQDVADHNAVGSATDTARADHLHKGVHSIAKGGGGTPIYGDATISEGSNISIVESGQDLQINVSGFVKTVISGATIADNQASPSPLFTTPVTGIRGLKITFGIRRGSGNSWTSDFFLATDGVGVSAVPGLGTELGDTGVTLTADISGGNARFLYTSTSTGTAGDIDFEVTQIPA